MKNQNLKPEVAALQVLMSNHIQSVEVTFAYEEDGVRYYDAVTYAAHGERHDYRVRFWEDSDGARMGKCNCPAGYSEITCRHIIRAAALDSIKTNQELHAPTLAAYKAARCSAAAVKYIQKEAVAAMANEFRAVTVTTKRQQACAACYKKLPPGANTLAWFDRQSDAPSKVDSVFLCDADCLVEYQAVRSGETLDKFLNDLAVQFN